MRRHPLPLQPNSLAVPTQLSIPKNDAATTSHLKAAFGVGLLHRYHPVFEDAGPQPFLHEPYDTPVADPVLQEADDPFLGNFREEGHHTLPTTAR